MDIILKSAQKLEDYPKIAQKILDVLLKSQQNSFKLS